jgi:hydroxypyruvate isomerase
MPRFAANISTMFADRPFVERIEAAAGAGFKAVECQFPYVAGAAELKAKLAASKLPLVLLNTPPGDFAAGERGLAGLPGREAEFEAALGQALTYAQALDCPMIHVMAGVRPAGVSREACLATFKANLRRAADACASAGRLALIEPINSRDIPAYLLNTPAEGAALLAELNHPALKLQFDFYHAQIMAGDLARSFERFQEITAHVQIAGVPERHEPDTGEVNYSYIFELLDRRGYSGWVGCEYFPAGGTEAGLGWGFRHGIAPKATLLATGGERV